VAQAPSLSVNLYTTSDSTVDKRYMDQMKQQDKTPVATDTSLPRITLVVGPSPFTMPRGWEFFLTSPYEGISYISTVLYNAGYPVRIVDVRYVADALETAYQQIMAGTDVLGVATFEDNFPFVQQLIDRVKTDRPDIPVLVGGSLVTSVPRIFMEHTKADIAVISEGELTILEVMDSYVRGEWPHKLSDIHGIWYRDANGIGRATKPRGQMPNLESLPRMRLDLWPQYHSPLGLQPQIIASYSRGCKMDCSFCYRTTPQERVKSPAKLDEELTWLRERYNTEFVFFVDLTFTAHKAQTLEYLDVIKPHNLSWTCLTRCADVDPERLKAMKQAGADIVLYGVESLGADILKTARKGNNENITTKAMTSTWDADLRFGGLLIVGLPGETEESLEHACQWAEQYQHITRVKYLSAMPGTTVYQEGIKTGHIKSEIDHLNWLSIEQALVQDEFLNYNGLPEKVVRKAYKRIYDSYQPGPVLNFKHWPEHFEFFHPNENDGAEHVVQYRDYTGTGGTQWRANHSSAARPLLPEAPEFTLSRTGVPQQAESNIEIIRDPSGLPAPVLPPYLR
jgi:anaerobic magnesium-protoporphyrin IX monomethyl ester cyclase